jgi:hypothetical protein
MAEVENMKTKNKRIITEHQKPIRQPSNAIWNLFDAPKDIDAVKLVEQSWKKDR